MSIVVLTGAGISADSGLPTFRGPDGLWEGHRIFDVATVEGFARNPALVQQFYNRLRRRLRDPQVSPNAAHEALVRLEQAAGAGFHLVTQNIDDLHQRSGSEQVTAMHGELTKIRHVDTGDVIPWYDDVPDTECKWRPHVVWFGERTLGLHQVAEKLSSAELFIAIGTAGAVHPASQFVNIARRVGAMTIQVNTEPVAGLFDHTLHGPASELVPELVDHLIADLR
jgi:NAD-dependent deacetylase